MKTILVTGGLGFIGKNFIQLALNTKLYKIINIDAGSYAADFDFQDKMVKEYGDKYYISLISPMQHVDISSLCKKYKVEYIINFAAESHVDNSISGPTVFFENNVMGTQDLIEKIRRMGEEDIKQYSIKRFIHISTDEVYGDLPLEGDEKFTEDTPYDPSSPYSASKASSDHIVASYRRTYGLPFYITHCSNNYGPGQHVEKLIPKTIYNFNMCLPAKIYGKGENMRDWIHVDDHNRGILMLMTAYESDLGGHYVFNFGGGNCINNVEMARKIWSAMKDNQYDHPYEDEMLEYIEDRKGHDLRYEVDYSRAKKHLGWEPLYDLDAGIEQTVKAALEDD